MSLTLRVDETVRDGLCRLVEGLMEDAIEWAGGDDRDAAVHEVRKRCKEARALLRLVRGSAPWFRTEQRWLRDTGRMLAAARDRATVNEAMQALLAQSALPVDVEEWLVKQAAADVLADEPVTARLGEAAERLGALQDRTRTWELTADGFEAIETGLHRTGKDARQGYRRSARTARAEVLHGWRKRVKDQRYQTEALADASDRLRMRNARLERLSDILGHHHDATLLQGAIADADPAGEQHEQARKAIDARTGRLEIEALNLGSRLFTAKPHTFVKEVREDWRAWRS